jgi:cobyrinic acid a,c-diamide synthase
VEALLGPRVVIAGTHSGAGKTTVATGLMAAYRRRGVVVAGAKVGPDFIDPGYHAVACRRPPRNLDPWMCGARAVAPLAARAAAGAALLIVEGVMGLFDGAADGGPSSTADVARLLGAPVVLVVDAASVSTSVAATVHGFATYDPAVTVAGVIFNRVGSPTHEILLREAVAGLGVPVLGAVGRDDRLRWRDRHLGLVPVAEHRDGVEESVTALAEVIAAGVDLQALEAVARSAPPMPVETPAPVEAPAGGVEAAAGAPRVAVAGGRAFTFVYRDTVEALEAAGAEVAVFDPLTDASLPGGTDGLLVGGGFPEVYAGDLGANRPLLDGVRRAVAAGTPTWAECGGLVLLCRQLETAAGDRVALAGAVAASATMTDRLVLGYRRATVGRSCVAAPAGAVLRGHEFHYSTVAPAGDALDLASRWGSRPEGWAGPDLLATYFHYHPGGDPRPVARFVARCAAYRRRRCPT